jgi:hypothetical protein
MIERLPSDFTDMDAIASLDSTTTQTAQAVQSGPVNPTSGATTAQTQAQKLGLPPAGLVGAAVANTVNAALVSSQWGIDPNSVSGVYGGAGASGGLFSGASTLTLLQSLTSANAEQALALLGIQTPTPSSRQPAAATTRTAAATAAREASAATAALAESSGGADVGTTVDPLFGVRA